jgi:hypothetical protein
MVMPMLDNLPGRTPPPRRTTVRTAALVLVVAVVALGLVAVAGKVFGVFDGSGTATTTAQAAASASAQADAALDPAPTLVCNGPKTAGVFDHTADAKGEDTPLAATQTWFATVAHNEELTEARQFAAPAGAAPTARVIGWFDRDGTLRAEATVVQTATGGWLLETGEFCA